jgi:hypothetical protein
VIPEAAFRRVRDGRLTRQPSFRCVSLELFGDNIMKPFGITVLILTAGNLVASGLFAQGASEKDQALAEIKKLGGTVVSFPFSVSFDGKGVTDDALVHVQKLSDIEGLYLRKCKVTDKGLEKLAKLTKLKYLYLNATAVSDVGLEHLENMRSLQALSLVRTQVTDEGLAHLKGLSALRTLEIKGTRVTDAGVATLKKSLPKLVVR